MSKPGRVAGWSLLGAVLVYGWGYLLLLGVHDIEELCGSRGHPWEFDPNRRESLLPLSSPCNASYDLIPPYLNPIFFALLASAVVFTVIAVVRRVRGEKT
ncbi:hypothetical protein [Lentzea sp.]|uniref:hypothetical protein n=1 Tax=Lentzea sp. TaxID=56099 RepID=UPI002CD3DEE2|nr:hypothetical protein [Lentzea sp.]HUQ58914.1 hypothetical protein [Lentzea sp.]